MCPQEPLALERIGRAQIGRPIVEQRLHGGLDALVDGERRQRVERQGVDVHAGVAVGAAAQADGTLLLAELVFAGDSAEAALLAAQVPPELDRCGGGRGREQPLWIGEQRFALARLESSEGDVQLIDVSGAQLPRRPRLLDERCGIEHVGPAQQRVGLVARAQRGVGEDVEAAD
jgi:hypothetical protein